MSTTNIASPATSSRAQNLNWLTWHLTKARFRSRQGESLLYLASILAYTVCAGLALTAGCPQRELPPSYLKRTQVSKSF